MLFNVPKKSSSSLNDITPQSCALDVATVQSCFHFKLSKQRANCRETSVSVTDREHDIRVK